MSQTNAKPRTSRTRTREILALAVPAFGALIVEPLFLIADTAMIGHLGTAQLAGVGLASAVLQTATGLMIFLAYSTTPAVARFIGAGHPERAMARGRDGIWLGLFIGIGLGVLGWFSAPWLIEVLGGTGDVHLHAVNYLRYSMLGLPAMLAVLAATGVLRGMQDTRTPLVVAGVGFGVNILANYLLIYVLGFGVIGSALGTSVIQWLMLATYLIILAPKFRGIGLAPTAAGMRATAAIGSWLLLRSASLRVAILLTVLTATGLGTEVLAAHQIIFTLYSTLAFALDALAIAAQALVGKELGEAEAGTASLDSVHALTKEMTRWSVGFGIVTGVLLLVLTPWLPYLFTTDPAVLSLARAGLIVLAISQPLAGYVFVLDGILMGASDARYLALAGVVALAIYLPALAIINFALPAGNAVLQIVAVWIGFALIYLGARALTLGLRIRTDKWMLSTADKGY